MINLIANASKFSGRETTIDVTVVTRWQHVRVAVADRGPGIPKGTAKRLFEPYYRATGAREAGKKGTGLGLAIVNVIVEAHGGRVAAKNGGGGRARFWFELPALPLGPLPHLSECPPRDKRR